jgi:deoxyribodipyrimidine photo-lyase
MPEKFSHFTDPGRVIATRSGTGSKGPVIYWMSRDQRVRDNWALNFASQLAEERNVPLGVVFILVPTFLGATWRQYDFMLRGLEEVGETLDRSGIPFYLLKGDPPAELDRFVRQHGIGTVVSDFDPLRIKRTWKKSFLERTETEFYTVDAHNIVPAFLASDKQEFGAYTLRPKIRRLLESFLVPFPEWAPFGGNESLEAEEIDWPKVRNGIQADTEVKPVEWISPGEPAARSVMQEFINGPLDRYAEKSNDPNAGALSNLSPYLHFGQISAQRVALEILRERPSDANTESYLEELIIRRELSDNYCLYNPDYDSLKNIPAWAQKTLKEHARDEREFIYGMDDFEKALTHDELWNAAQKEMVISGKMHGYMRMYWAKKILEWSSSAEKAMETAVFLNDRYQLDGRDPNGYTGCAWSVGGVHDRAWSERPVFGKIRYMNDKGCRRKFDVDAYIRTWI